MSCLSLLLIFNGISFVKERQAAKNRDLTMISNNLSSSYARPTPISIKVDVTIITKYMTDLYQIYGKLATQFQPTLTYSWFVPQMIDSNWTELRNKIEWDGELSLDVRTESKESDEDKFTGKMGFSIDGWLFPTMNRCYDGIIYNIGTTIVPSEDAISRIHDEISAFRPLVQCVMNGKEWDKYNNPRQFGTAHPMITSVYMSKIINSQNVNFILDKHRAKTMTFNQNSRLIINGYNLKDVKVLMIPNTKREIDMTLYTKKYNTELHPFPDNLKEKHNEVSGYLLNIKKQTDNQVIIDFDKSLINDIDFDIAIVNDIDYDLLSKRKGFTLKS